MTSTVSRIESRFSINRMGETLACKTLNAKRQAVGVKLMTNGQPYGVVVGNCDGSKWGAMWLGDFWFWFWFSKPDFWPTPCPMRALAEHAILWRITTPRTSPVWDDSVPSSSGNSFLLNGIDQSISCSGFHSRFGWKAWGGVLVLEEPLPIPILPFVRLFMSAAHVSCIPGADCVYPGRYIF